MAEQKSSIIVELVDKFSKQMDTVSGKFGTSIKNMLTSRLSIAALSAAVGVAILDFARFETKITDVVNLFNGSREDIKKYGDAVLDVSTRVPQAVDDLSSALFDVVSAGVDAKDATMFLEEAAKLATAGVTDTKTAVDGLTSVINAYGMRADEVTDVSDKFFMAQKFGKTTIAELSGAIGKVAPIASAAGISLDELLGTVSTLTLKGLGTAEAVTAVRGAISSIIKPTKEAQDLAAGLGIQFNSQSLQANGLNGVLEDVVRSTGGNKEQMAKLFGQVEALNGVLALSADGFQKVKEVQNGVAESFGATDEAFQMQMDNMSAKIQIFKNNVGRLSKEFIEKLSPAVNGAIDVLNRLMAVIGTQQKEVFTTAKIKEYYDYLSKKDEESLKRYGVNLEERKQLALEEVNWQKAQAETFSGDAKKAAEERLKTAQHNLDKLKKEQTLYHDFVVKQSKETNTKIITGTEQTNGQIQDDTKNTYEKVKDEYDYQLSLIKKTRDVNAKEEADLLEKLSKKYKLSADERKKLLTEINNLLAKHRDEQEKEEKKFLEDAEKQREQHEKDVIEAVIDSQEEQLKAWEDSQKKKKELEEDLYKTGYRFAVDYRDGIKELINTSFMSPDGFLKDINSGMKGLFGDTMGSFVSGAVGGLITTGVTSLVQGILGNSKTKTVADFAQESFQKMVDNTNRALDEIGKERDKVETQIDLLKELQSQFGNDYVIPERFLSALELSSGTTIQQGLKKLLKDLQSVNIKDIDTYKKAIADAEKEISQKQPELEAGIQRQKDYKTARNTGDLAAFNEKYGTSYSTADEILYGEMGLQAKIVELQGTIQGLRNLIVQNENLLRPAEELPLETLLNTTRLAKEINELLGLDAGADLDVPMFANGGSIKTNTPTAIVNKHGLQGIVSEYGQAETINIIPHGGNNMATGAKTVQINLIVNNQVFARAIVDSLALKEAGVL